MTTIHASEVTMSEFQFANVTTELAGSTRTKACDLNLGPWEIAPAEYDYPAIVNWFVSLTADGREFKIFRFVTRADALQWVEDVCGHVNWVEM